MPDNTRDGTLEDFLVSLIKKDIDLYHDARTPTLTSALFHTRYAAADFDKAALHARLAWQECPGLPDGSAIEATYFEHDTEIADRFGSWYRRLFEIAGIDAALELR
jgi:hypothetical protein